MQGERGQNTDLINYDIKIRNIRFMSELVKFGIYYEGNVNKMVENMQMCFEKFHGQNIEIVCNFIETCGRYYMNVLDPVHLKKFNEQLDLMWRLKEKEKISSRQLANIEQAYYMCRPSKYRASKGAPLSLVGHS